MKLAIVTLFLFAQAAVAQVTSDSLPKQLPDSSLARDKKEFARLLPSHPPIEPDGIAIGNVKYFIMIVKPDPLIDYGMIRRIPIPLNFKNNPEEPRKAEKRLPFR